MGTRFWNGATWVEVERDQPEAHDDQFPEGRPGSAKPAPTEEAPKKEAPTEAAIAPNEPV